MENNKGHLTKDNVFKAIFVALFSLAILITEVERMQSAGNMRDNELVDAESLIVVVDAGHGGVDPGKVGINQELEKDINLKIAQMLKEKLEECDVPVVMTRTTEDGLYDENSSNKKMSDLKKRIEIIEKSKCVLAVSIHQNSYNDSSIHGAQVFYYNKSLEGKKAAQSVQDSLARSLSDGRGRTIKANDNYYLLKKSSVATIIVECGFLSNANEAHQLSTDSYREKVAGSICEGIIMYLNEGNSDMEEHFEN